MFAVLAAVAGVPVGCGDESTPPTAPERDAPPDTALATDLPLAAAAEGITGGAIGASIEALAHDSTLGRATPSPELEEAAAWVARRFRAAGLEPAGREPGADGGGGAEVAEDGVAAFLHRWTLEGPEPATPPNVVARLPGSDSELAGTHVVLTAHLDHVGVGAPDGLGDSIYNGADDNASGVAVVLALADALASLPAAPRRSILFVVTSGEERGLLGARAYVDSPTVPIASMVAALNFDMVGRASDGVLHLIGEEYSTLGPLAQEVDEHFPELGIELVRLGDPTLFRRSDQWEFARGRVPAIFFHTGLHGEYHTPRDEVDEIDATATAQVARLALWVTGVIASAEVPPEWTPEGEQAMAGTWIAADGFSRARPAAR